MMKLKFRFVVAAVLWGPALATPLASAASEVPLSLERALEAGRQLAAKGEAGAAARAIRVALIYDRSVVGRRYEAPAQETELLTAFLSFVDSDAADQFTSAGAATRRRLVRTLLETPANGSPQMPERMTDEEFCRTVHDLSDLRPAQMRRSLGPLLADGAQRPACLVQSLFFNTEIRAEDTAVLREIGKSGDSQAVTALVRQLVTVGRSAEALALAAQIRDSQLRAEVERAVVSSRQLTSLKLPRAETSTALFDAILRQTGAERLVYGALLATQAAPEFWMDHASAIHGFLSAAPSDGMVAALREIWSRQVLARAGYSHGARVWTVAPSLMPAPGFIAAFLFLRDDVPAISGPGDQQLGTIPAALRRLATVARLVRLPGAQLREAAGLFRALLDSYPAQSGRARLTALDAGFLAVAAARIERASQNSSGPTR